MFAPTGRLGTPEPCPTAPTHNPILEAKKRPTENEKLTKRTQIPFLGRNPKPDFRWGR